MRMLAPKHLGLWAAFVLMLGMMLAPAGVWAASEDPACTSFSTLAVGLDRANTEEGILTNITKFVKDVINDSSRKLFEAFINSASYRAAVNAAATLVVVFYGVAFTIGVVQASFGEVLKRLIRLGLIFTLISPTGWDFFSKYVVTFFNDGTDQLIGIVLSIGMGGTYTAGTSPFLALDGMAKFLLSPDMIVAVMGAMGDGGPFGLMMGSLLGFGVVGFIMLLLQGLKMYAISFIVRALLLGVAPVFFVFMLFDKTRQMFTGWVNLLVNTSLQPILYFTFLSFFLVMISDSAKNMMNDKELCWTSAQFVAGSSNPQAFWKFKDETDQFPRADKAGWKGLAGCVATGTDCAEFPLNIVDLLTFVILVYVGTKFAGVVDNIANEISNTSLNLDTGARSDMMQQAKGAGASGGPINTSTGGVRGTKGGA